MQPLSEVRPLGSHDLEAYRRLRLRALAETPENFGTAFSEAREMNDAAWLAELLPSETPWARVLGVFIEEKLVAIAALQQGHLAATAHNAAITRVYVSPEIRRQKLGHTLLLAGIAAARSHPALCTLTLSVATSALPARKLYDALGFVPFGVDPMAFRIAGKWIALEHRQLLLRKT